MQVKGRLSFYQARPLCQSPGSAAYVLQVPGLWGVKARAGVPLSQEPHQMVRRSGLWLWEVAGRHIPDPVKIHPPWMPEA